MTKARALNHLACDWPIWIVRYPTTCSSPVVFPPVSFVFSLYIRAHAAKRRDYEAPWCFPDLKSGQNLWGSSPYGVRTVEHIESDNAYLWIVTQQLTISFPISSNSINKETLEKITTHGSYSRRAPQAITPTQKITTDLRSQKQILSLDSRCPHTKPLCCGSQLINFSLSTRRWTKKTSSSSVHLHLINKPKLLSWDS